MQRLPSSAASSGPHGCGHKAAIGSAINQPAAMTAVLGEAAARPSGRRPLLHADLCDRCVDGRAGAFDPEPPVNYLDGLPRKPSINAEVQRAPKPSAVVKGARSVDELCIAVSDRQFIDCFSRMWLVHQCPDICAENHLCRP